MALAFTGTATTYGFTGASNSASRTVPAGGDGVVLGLSVFNGSGDTIAVTIAGSSATESYTGGTTGKDFIGVWIGVATGSQTVALSGADAGDDWSIGIKAIGGIDTSDPFDGAVTDTASPGSINVTTSSDGLAVGVHEGGEATTTSDTEEWEAPLQGDVLSHCASAAGTGGTVALDWSPAGFSAAAVNMRAAAAAATHPTRSHPHGVFRAMGFRIGGKVH